MVNFASHATCSEFQFSDFSSPAMQLLYWNKQIKKNLIPWYEPCWQTHTVGVSTLYIFNVPNSEIVYQRKFILQIINYHLVGWNKLQLFTYNCTIWTFRFQIHYLMAACVDAYVDGFRLQVGILFVGYLLWWISQISFDESEIKFLKDILFKASKAC